MRKIELKEQQQIELNLLNAFASFCEKENLKYMLDYGTLLGCIRHKGFIPWDDDIDVSMPREDYDKLEKLLEANPKALGEHIRLATYKNKYSVQKAYFNVIDIRTITHSNARRKKYYYPLWIDIFPVDIMPDDDNKAKEMLDTTLGLIAKCQNSYGLGYPGRLQWFRRQYNKFDVLFLKSRLEKIEKISRSVKQGKRLICYAGYNINDVFYSSYFDNYIMKDFEGNKFRVPAEYDKRLSDIYGNYMQLPPEEKRLPHLVDAYWK